MSAGFTPLALASARVFSAAGVSSVHSRFCIAGAYCDFLHVHVRRMKQRADLGDRENGDSAGHP
jgi:hypothetical protein